MVKNLDAKQLKNAFLAAANNLDRKKEVINELNVFPVPDGDTGTNMTMTVMSAARELAVLEEPSLQNVSKAIADGSLRGARGNSGVILSQLIRGFTKEILENTEVDSLTLSRAFLRGVETAYKAVMKPKEGTILTVAKAMADKISELAVFQEDIVPMMEEVLRYGDETLARTPDMLPVLKEAGVVDSGGQGLMELLWGALAYLRGDDVDLLLRDEILPSSANRTGAVKSKADISTADIEFGYCTEFMINADKVFTDDDVEELRKWLSEIGDSIVCFSDENIIKVHVHTNHPGECFEKGLTMGFLSKMKVDNLRLEHHEVLIKDASRIAAAEKVKSRSEKQAPVAAPPREGSETGNQAYLSREEAGLPSEKEIGFISICAGDGLARIFKEIGVDYVISGGQTMNPSTQDILRAVQEVDAHHIFILPNNKNIILAARQAVFLVKDKELHVIPSTSIPQGISAMIGFQADLSVEENEKYMMAALSAVSSAEITYSVRDTMIEGKEIHKGDIMCLSDTGLIAVSGTVDEAVKEAMSVMIHEDSEIATLYYGIDVQEKDAEKLQEELRGLYPHLEIELESGGQPVYYYFLSIE